MAQPDLDHMGTVVSHSQCWNHLIPSTGTSSGWTGMSLYVFNVHLGQDGPLAHLLDHADCSVHHVVRDHSAWCWDARVNGQSLERCREVMYDLEFAWGLLGSQAQWRDDICQKDWPHEGFDHSFCLQFLI